MTVDLSALAQQLADDPERRAALLAALVGEDPSRYGFDRQLAELTSTVDQLTKQMHSLAEAQQETARVTADLVSSMRTINDRVGALEGEMFERRSRERAAAYFADLARRLKVIGPDRLSEVADDAVDAGRITTNEYRQLMLADAVLSGRREGSTVHLVVEASVTLNYHDVQRARARVDILAKVVDTEVIAVVHGQYAPDGVLQAAGDADVWQLVGGRLIDPAEPDDVDPI